MTMFAGVITVALIVVVAVAVVAFLIVSMKKGSHGSSGSLSGAALEIQALLEPSRRHTVEELHKRDEIADADQTGDPDRT